MAFVPDLTQIKNRENLIHFLEVDEVSFKNIIEYTYSDSDFDDHLEDVDGIITANIPPFFRHKIPKKSRGDDFRIVWEIFYFSNIYKALARRLGAFFSYKLESFPHHRSFGYVGGRNIRENAIDHCGHKNLICVDIKNFFPSITTSRITELLVKTGVDPNVAFLLSQFVTIDNSLPLGFPTSPVISNAICLDLDNSLDSMATGIDGKYSRYADDMSISSNYDLPKIDDIYEIIRIHGFEPSTRKTRISKLGQAHYVTGLSVSDVNGPHVPRSIKKKLRQELFYSKKFGFLNHLKYIEAEGGFQSNANRIDGLVKYVAYHEKNTAYNFINNWNFIRKRDRISVSFEPKNQNRSPYHICIDEAEYERPNKARALAIAMSVSRRQDIVNASTERVLNSAISDVWAAGNIDVISKRGLHFSDATLDLRLEYAKVMRALPFDGFVAIASLGSNETYEDVYCRVLKSMVRRRLIAAESKKAVFIIEKNSKVKESRISEVIDSAHCELVKTKNRHPVQHEIKFVGKPNSNVSVPDFMLGILGGFLMSGPIDSSKPNPREVLLFERIRDKYRTIYDLDYNLKYSRRNPVRPWGEGGKS